MLPLKLQIDADGLVWEIQLRWKPVELDEYVTGADLTLGLTPSSHEVPFYYEGDDWQVKSSPTGGFTLTLRTFSFKTITVTVRNIKEERWVVKAKQTGYKKDKDWQLVTVNQKVSGHEERRLERLTEAAEERRRTMERRAEHKRQRELQKRAEEALFKRKTKHREAQEAQREQEVALIQQLAKRRKQRQRQRQKGKVLNPIVIEGDGDSSNSSE